MTEDDAPPAGRRRRPLLCPSAAAEDGNAAFAVRGAADARGAAVGYLDEVVPVTASLLALAEPVDPRQVFRFAGPCAERGCGHFAGARCSLGGQVVADLPAVVDDLPRCRIRAHCRWFAERGGAACVRCPAVVTLREAVPSDYVDAVTCRAAGRATDDH